MSELRLLETVSLPFEAEHLQQVLATQGIEAFVEGVHGSNTFGMNALMGAIKIRVRDKDLTRARQALSAMHTTGGSPWYCGTCQETNEASFDVCWKCRGDRSEVECPRPEPSAELATAESIDFTSPHAVTRRYDPSPYAPPNTEVSYSEEPPATHSAQAEYENDLEQAYRASVIGLITLPLVLHVYSVTLLISAMTLPASTPPKLRWRFLVAWSINVTVLAAAAIVFWAIL